MRSAELAALTAEWDERLARSGFRDIELRRARKTGKLYRPDHVYTYDHETVSLDDAGSDDTCRDAEAPALVENLTVFGDVTGTSDLPVAGRFRTLGALVQALPCNYRGRRLLEVYAETGDLVNSAKTTGYTRQQARTIVARFERKAGLTFPRGAR